MRPPNLAESSKPRDSKHRLLVLLAIVLLSRLVFAFIVWKINGPSGVIGSDTPSYVGPARSLLHGAFLSDGSFGIPGAAEIFRTPGYPLFLVPAVALGHVELIALGENLLLAVASAWLIWHIVTGLIPDPRAACWAVLLYCFEPVGFLYSQKVFSETLFTTVLLLFVWLFLRYFRKPAYLKLALSVLALSCAAYVRPVPLYLGIWLIPVLLLFPRTISWRQRAARAVLFPVLFGLTLVPWIERNSKVAGYDGFTTSSDWNLYFLAAGAVEAKLEHRGPSEVLADWNYDHMEQYLQSHPEMRGWSQAQIARFWGREARRIIGSHVVLYSGIHARGCAMVMFNPGVSELLIDLKLYPKVGSPISRELDHGFVHTAGWLLREYPVTAIALPLMLLQLLLYYVFAIKGLRRIPSEVAVFFCAVFSYFVLVSGMPAAVARYRAPIMPLVCICAGIAIAAWKTRKANVPAQIDTA